MDNKPSQADSSGQDVSPQEGSGNVSAQESDAFSLKEINEVSGREFESKEDFKKHYENLKSFVGDNTIQSLKEKAQKFDELQSKKSETQKQSDVNSDYYDKVDKMEFIFKNPDAKSVVDDVAAIAKAKGVSMDEAYENSYAKQIVENQKKENEQVNPPYVEGGKLPEKQSITKEEFRNLPLEEQQKIVQKFSAWNQPLGKK